MLDRQRHFLFNLNVLEEITDASGNIDIDNALSGLKSLKKVLALVINEGKNEGEPDLTEYEVGRIVHTENLPVITKLIKRAFAIAVIGKEEPLEYDEIEDEIKNAGTGKAE